MAGSKPGERRGGRKAGTLNKATADVKIAASQYTEAAVAELARIMRESESDAARVSAIKEILDRGHGKSAQAVNVSGSLGLAIRKIELVGVRPSDNSQAGDTR